MDIRQIGNSILINGDCLEVMEQLIQGGVKVNAVIADIPYGTTACKWDVVIPLDKMWDYLNKIIKENGVIVLFGTEPFSSALRMSNIKNFKYDWIWEKSKATGYLNAKKQPLRANEIISVFYSKQCVYNPQMKEGIPYNKGMSVFNGTESYGKETKYDNKNDSGLRFPRSIIYFKTAEFEGKFHPTQKPVALMEYLVNTYTNECDLVLDFTMGSGTTGVACKNLNRKFIGIELDKGYFDIACKRIEEGK